MKKTILMLLPFLGVLVGCAGGESTLPTDRPTEDTSVTIPETSESLDSSVSEETKPTEEVLDGTISILNKDQFVNISLLNTFGLDLDVELSNPSLTYQVSSSDVNVAEIKDNKIFVKGLGTTTITATIDQGSKNSDSFQLEVIDDKTTVTKIKDVTAVGSTYTVEGYVVANDMKNKFSIIDDTGCLAVFDTLTVQIGAVNVGTEVRLTGVLGEYEGLKELTEVDMAVSSVYRNFPKASPKVLTKEDIEGYDGVYALYCNFDATLVISESHFNFRFDLSNKPIGGFTYMDIIGDQFGIFEANDGDKMNMTGVLFGKATFTDNAYNFLPEKIEFKKQE